MDHRPELQELADQLAAGKITVKQYTEKLDALVTSGGEAKDSKVDAARASSAVADDQIKSAVRRALAL